MAENIEINGTTYPGVESVELNTTDGKKVLYFQGQPVEVVQETGSDETAVMSQAAVTRELEQLNSEKADQASLTLGYHTDGLIYIFAGNTPLGHGIEMTAGGDVVGYVDSANNIVVKGSLADGSYTVKYEMEDGSTINIGNLVLDTNVYYSITKNLTQCTINNSATQVIQGESYSATITAKSGYELKSISVTMGGNPVTVSGGVINIASVTGNIVITALAEQKQAAQPVTEDIALTKNMSIVVGTGADRANTASYCTTPHIDVSNIPKPCSIHLTGARWTFSNAAESGYIRFYIADKSGTKLASDYTYSSKMPSGVTMTVNDNESDVTVTVTSDNVGTLRFAGHWAWSGIPGFDSVNMIAKATLTYTPES